MVQNRSLEQIFDADVLDGYQRRYMIHVQPKSLDCYFLEQAKMGQVFHFSFEVLNAGPTGHKLDITAYVRNPAKRAISTFTRVSEGNLLEHETEKDGQFEVCFNNKYSIMESKKIFWQYEIQGVQDMDRRMKQIYRITVDDFHANHASIRKAVKDVLRNVRRVNSHQNILNHHHRSDTLRMAALAQLIDRISAFHVVATVVIAFGQVTLLKRLFNIK